MYAELAPETAAMRVCLQKGYNVGKEAGRCLVGLDYRGYRVPRIALSSSVKHSGVAQRTQAHAHI